MSSSDAWPAWLTGLIDDAAIFPPGNASVDRAVAEHHAARAGELAGLVGRFVVSDLKVPELIDVLDEHDGEEHEPLDIALVVTGGAGAIGPAVRWASRAPSLRLGAIELALRDEDDLAHNARRALTALETCEDDIDEVPTYVELPRFTGTPSHGWLSALDELASADLRVKFRTGGLTADLFPSPDELAAGIDAALDRELAFKCTAGLHRALRHHDEETGATHHGFLNLLVATRVCLDGGDAAAALAETSPAGLLDGVSPEELERTRRWFTGFGSCSLLEPHDDLVELGILPQESAP